MPRELTLGSDGARSSAATGSGAADARGHLPGGHHRRRRRGRPSTTRWPTSPGWCAPSASATRPSACRWSRRSAPTPGTGCSPVRGRPSCTRSSSWTGGRHHAPSTPGDLLFHIRASRWTCASSWRAGSSRRWRAPSPSSTRCTASGSSTTATCWASSTAPRTRTGRSRCPPPQIGDEDPDFAGGCYVHVQKYLHDMASWNSLSVDRAGAGDRAHQARGHRDGRRRQAGQLAHRAQRDRGRRRQRAEDRPAQHAVRRDRQGRVRHLLHRLLAHRRGHRADAAQHVHRRPAGQHRPHPRLLHRDHRRHVLHADRRLPRRPTAACRIRSPTKSNQQSPSRPSPPTGHWRSAA